MDHAATGSREYRVVYVDTRGRISSDGVEFIRQGGEHRTTFVSRYLSTLAQEGWTLAGIHPLARPETAYYVLERPGAASGEPPAAPGGAADA